MEKFKQVKSGMVGSLKEQNPNNVTLVLESGEEKVYSISTFKRWWKLIIEDDQEIIEMSEPVIMEAPIVEDVVKTSQVEAPTEEVITKEVTIIEEITVVEEVVPTERPVGEILKGYLEVEAEMKGCELYHNENQRFITLKVKGSRIMAFTYNKKGVDLWLYSDICEGIVEYRTMNRKLDAGVKITDFSLESRMLITKMVDASIARLNNN